MFGGRASGGANYGDVWELANGSWKNLVTVDVDEDGGTNASLLPGFTYDASRDVLFFMPYVNHKPARFVFGTTSDTERPAHIFSVRAGEMGICSTWEMDDVRIHWEGGGTGGGGSPEQDGVQLLVWDEGQWRAVATDTLSATDPGAIAWVASDPLMLARLTTGVDEAITFGLTSQYPNGTGRGRITTEYVELVLRYRIAADDAEQCGGAGP